GPRRGRGGGRAARRRGERGGGGGRIAGDPGELKKAERGNVSRSASHLHTKGVTTCAAVAHFVRSEPPIDTGSALGRRHATCSSSEEETGTMWEYTHTGLRAARSMIVLLSLASCHAEVGESAVGAGGASPVLTLNSLTLNDLNPLALHGDGLSP